MLPVGNRASKVSAEGYAEAGREGSFGEQKMKKEAMDSAESKTSLDTVALETAHGH